MRLLLDVNVCIALPDDAHVHSAAANALRDQMARVCNDLNHEFWADDISLRDAARGSFDRVRGHNQITDLYLLALTVRHGGSLATFDQGIALTAVADAQPRHLTLL